ncbi:MAG: macro domain-containing protein [Myxococcales bacterium]|nr:macro domain-containing protein [Myxococcota bacterium]MDW8281180.1 macro domain-containing protein [Myxococcales bacterium]
MPLHLHLCDRNTPLRDAWEAMFADQPLVTVHLDDFFAVEADIMVAGGDSLGLMDSGLELAIALKLGPFIRERIQEALRRDHDGMLPVGQALVVPTEDRRWPLLVLAPTMYLPMDVSQTIHPYLAARAALRCWRSLAQSQGNRVWHMLMPGLGTGPGRVQPATCARQMRRAYDEVVLGHRKVYASLDEAMADYRYLVEGSERRSI